MSNLAGEPPIAQKQNQNKVNAALPYLFGAVGLSFIIYISIISAASLAQCSDFPEFYAVAQQVLTGNGPDVYDVKALTHCEQSLFPVMREINRYVGFFPPPYAIPWLVPIGLVPLPAAIVIWKVVQLSALIASLVLLALKFGLRKEGIGWLFAWILLTGPAYEAIRLDQLAPLLLLSLTLAILLIEANRPMYAGIALAFLFLKPQDALPVIVVLLALKDYATISFSILWAAIVGAAALLMLGAKAFYNYKSFMDLALSSDAILKSNISSTLRGQLLLLFPAARHNVEIISTVVLGLTLLTIFFVAKIFAGQPRALRLSLAATLPLGFATALYCYDYDFLLLVPALVVMQQAFSKMSEFRYVGYAACFCALPFFVPFYIPLHYDYLLKGANINPIFLAVLAYALIALTLMVTNRRQLET